LEKSRLGAASDARTALDAKPLLAATRPDATGTAIIAMERCVYAAR